MVKSLTAEDRHYLKVMGQLRARCGTIGSEFRAGLITFKQVCRRLGELEEWAYKEMPDAEPDGDITYTVATTRDNLEKYANQNQTHRRLPDRGHPSTVKKGRVRNAQAVH